MIMRFEHRSLVIRFEEVNYLDASSWYQSYTTRIRIIYKIYTFKYTIFNISYTSLLTRIDNPIYETTFHTRHLSIRKRPKYRKRRPFKGHLISFRYTSISFQYKYEPISFIPFALIGGRSVRSRSFGYDLTLCAPLLIGPSNSYFELYYNNNIKGTRRNNRSLCA